MPDLDGMQQLHASNVSVNIGEALEARVKDPLWFLARQWQSGEFAAENGGRPAWLSLSWRDHPLSRLTVGGETRPIDRDEPLEFAVERETSDGDAPAWRAEALEYRFEAETPAHRFTAAEYHGRRLDWYHFDHAGLPADGAAAEPPAAQTRRMTPTQLYVRGAPNPRWWRFEDPGAQYDAAQDPEPNVLSMLLPELFYLDVNNWYVAPLPANTGTLREMTQVVVVDSFGVATTLGPASAGEAAETWRLFAPDPAVDSAVGTAGGPARLDGRFLLLPNVALAVLDNDDVEDVRFIRDEEANLVWAFEHRYRLPDGAVVVNGDRPADEAGTEHEVEGDDGRLRFVLRSETPPHWVPYVPRHVAAGPTSGEIYLRRARSVESATRDAPHYRSRVVGESWRVNEEEVPPTGVRIRRVARFARGSNGTAYHWIGRHKETGRRTAHPELRFDYLEPPTGD